MRRFLRRRGFQLAAAVCSLAVACAQQQQQTTFTWQELRESVRGEQPDVARRAAQHRRIEGAGDHGVPAAQSRFHHPAGPGDAVQRKSVPAASECALPLVSFSYLHERGNKRELRLESAQKATGIAVSQQADLVRTMLFNLRNAFVQTLQAKAVLAVAKENIAYYDHVLSVNADRVRLGDAAQIDLDRLELQRVQFESDVQTAEVNLRTAKIQLLTLLNDRTPVDASMLRDFRLLRTGGAAGGIAPDGAGSRPDLKAAIQAVDKAQTDHRLAVSNGSTDPTFGMDLGRNPPIPAYIGFSVNIPLRIFDRNQGEKARTQADITRNERLKEAAEAQVFSDVDSAYATLNSNVILLRPYKAKYLQLAGKVRETVSFAYQRGGASLLDFLTAQNDYRGRAGELSESGGRLFDGGEPTRSGGGARGAPVVGRFRSSTAYRETAC